MAGCSTVSESSKKLKTRLQTQMLVQSQTINATSNTAPEKAAEIQQLETKIELVQDLQNDFDGERGLMEKKVDDLTGVANLWSKEGIAVKRAGLLSGIAAAALVAASPANVVWVAGFSGFAGAANGYAAAAGAEGFSKAAVAAFLKPVVEEFNGLAKEFTTAEALVYLWKDSDQDKFLAAVAKQRVIINKISALRIKLLQPIVAIEADLKQREEMISEIKKRDDIIEELRQKLNKATGQ